MFRFKLFRSNLNASHTYLIKIDQQNQLFERLLDLAQKRRILRTYLNNQNKVAVFDQSADGQISYMSIGLISCIRVNDNRHLMYISVIGSTKAVEKLFEAIRNFDEIELQES